MTPSVREIAARLVAFDTESARSNAEAVAFMANLLADAGMEVALQEIDFLGVSKVNLVARAGPPVQGGLIVSGHVDVVPFESQEGWVRDPLKLEIDRDRVYGRGASDMKVFLAHCIEAAHRLDVRSLRRPLVLAFTCDEEIGAAGAARLAPALGDLLADTPVPRTAWIGEPTSYQLFHAHKGNVLFEIRVRGRGGHSSVPEHGVNAILAAARVIGRIERHAAELAGAPRADMRSLFPSAPHATIHVASIRGGQAANVIPDTCTIGVSYRPLPGDDPLALLDELRQGVAEDAAAGRSPAEGARVEIGPAFVLPAMLSRRDPKLEALLSDVAGAAEARGAPFATDGARFAEVGIDSLICGPGDLAQAHQPNESISRRAFETGGQVVLDVVRGYCASE